MMSVTLELPVDVERQLRARAADRGEEFEAFLLNTLRRAAETAAVNNTNGVPLRVEEDEGDAPWRGVFAVPLDAPRTFLGELDLRSAELKRWEPHITIDSRWMEDDE